MPLIKRKIQDIAKGLVTTKEPEKNNSNTDKVVSTGSTLLDLAISGSIRRGGGIPGGILVELFGLPMGGKTTLLGEICASAQSAGGFATIGDAERRMTPEFLQYMGVKVTDDNICYPQTVKEVEDIILNTPYSDNGSIDVIAVDSIAVLMSSMEAEKEDKRGSARAKELHQMCRKAKAVISDKNRLVILTNQVQDTQDAMPGQAKTKTAGGHAIPFLASLRISVTQIGKIEKKIKMGANEIKKAVGVHSLVKIIKSSIDIPYRDAEIRILFNYGVDDVSSNLDYIKKISGNTKYWAVTEEFMSLEKAVKYIEENNLQIQLKESTINLWEEVDAKFRIERSPKSRN